MKSRTTLRQLPFARRKVCAVLFVAMLLDVGAEQFKDAGGPVGAETLTDATPGLPPRLWRADRMGAGHSVAAHEGIVAQLLRSYKFPG